MGIEPFSFLTFLDRLVYIYIIKMNSGENGLLLSRFTPHKRGSFVKGPQKFTSPTGGLKN